MTTVTNLLNGIPQITPHELHERLSQPHCIFLLDVRESQEREAGNIGGEHIPKGSVSSKLDSIPRDREVVVYCRSGGRSQAIAEQLKIQHGYPNVMNLAGGMLAWARDIDPTLVVR